MPSIKDCEGGNYPGLEPFPCFEKCVPEIEEAIFDRESLPPLPAPIIEGVLYEGEKLLITGDSKGYKTTFCINLAVAVASGLPLCGLPCRQADVLYVNLEVGRAWFHKRVCELAHAYTEHLSQSLDPESFRKHLRILNARGTFGSIDELKNHLCKTCNMWDFGLIIIDPAYKLQTGSESEARAISDFCAALDEIAEELGCTVVFAHHHTKGTQAWKSIEDRASGSGVFARDPDSIIDLNVLEPGEEAFPPFDAPNAVPVRLEFVQRNCRQRDPIEAWVVYPLFLPDSSGSLRNAGFRKSSKPAAMRPDNKKRKTEIVMNKLLEIIGVRTEIDASEFMHGVDASFKAEVGKDWRTVKKYIDPALFRLETFNNNRTVIKRL